MGRRSLVVVSDLDGTLLDHDTYSAVAVRPALDRLRRAGAVIVLCSSKTRAEIEAVQRDLGLTGPFITENGGGVFFAAGSVPAGCWPFRRLGGYDLIGMGLPHAQVVARLRSAAGAAHVRIRGFTDMTAEDVAADSGLSVPRARLAKCRDFGEPFLMLDAGADAADRLARSCRDQGLTLTRGGRYHHASGPHDKGAAVRLLRDVLAAGSSRPLLVGFGDGLNDEAMLAATDVAVIVRGHDPEVTAELQNRLPGALVTPHVGPKGVAEVIDGALPSMIRTVDPDASWPGPGGDCAPGPSGQETTR
ncbi:MAG: HAD hydrolase family protein [Acidobacteriota bacterium]